MLKINHLNKSFQKRNIIIDFDYIFEDGIYGLLGPNGAGKTTLLRCITGIYTWKSGDIAFDDIAARNKMIGYLPQKFNVLPNLTVFEQLKYLSNVKGLPKNKWDEDIERVMSLMNISSLRDEKGRNLSGGMVRRLGIAQALLGQPTIIVLDEPTTGLDPEERIRFKNVMRQMRDVTVIISTHIVEDVEAVCDKILVMNQGMLKQHGDSEVIRNIAKGCVYHVEQQDVTDDDFVVSQREVDGKLMCRILTTRKLEDKRMVNPSVEDGYICILKNIGNI